MQLEEYFDTISPDEIRLKGHRINIEHIVERYQDGMTPQQRSWEHSMAFLLVSQSEGMIG